jgi:hypothetical protein
MCWNDAAIIPGVFIPLSLNLSPIKGERLAYDLVFPFSTGGRKG